MRKSLPPDLILASSTFLKDDESSLSGKSADFQTHQQEKRSQGGDSSEEGSVCSTVDGNQTVSDSKTTEENKASFLSLRIIYLIVTLVVMLADGLQGKLFFLICSSGLCCMALE